MKYYNDNLRPSNFLIVLFFLTRFSVKNPFPLFLSLSLSFFITILLPFFFFLDENEKSTKRLLAHLVKAFTFMRDLPNENGVIKESWIINLSRYASLSLSLFFHIIRKLYFTIYLIAIKLVSNYN